MLAAEGKGGGGGEGRVEIAGSLPIPFPNGQGFESPQALTDAGGVPYDTHTGAESDPLLVSSSPATPTTSTAPS